MKASSKGGSVRQFSQKEEIAHGDRTGWLGRQDSNLGMAESKSDLSARHINVHFEKSPESVPNSINRLATPSKCSSMLYCRQKR